MNPEDTFPPRRLPPEAEEWGRTVEIRVKNAEYAALGLGQSVDGENRANASSLSDLARQVQVLGETVDRVDELFRALPKTYQKTHNRRGMGLSTNSTIPLATVEIESPFTGQVVVHATATGQLVGNPTFKQITVGLSCDGDTSPGMYSVIGEITSTFNAAYGWTKPVVKGQKITVNLLANATSAWSPNDNAYAVLTALMTFTGS